MMCLAATGQAYLARSTGTRLANLFIIHPLRSECSRVARVVKLVRLRYCEVLLRQISHVLRDSTVVWITQTSLARLGSRLTHCARLAPVESVHTQGVIS